MEDKFSWFYTKVEQSVSVCNFQYIAASRSGPTAAGHTWETELGVVENNSKEADDNGMEYKTHRNKANNLITLLTCNPPKTNRVLLDTYGKKNSKGFNALYSETPSTPFTITRETTGLVISDPITQETLGGWDIPTIKENIQNKLSTMVLVKYDRKRIRGLTHFQYTSGVMYTEFNLDKFMLAMDSGIVKTCWRLKYKEDGSIRDHGTAFRIQESLLGEIYNRKIHLFDKEEQDRIANPD